MGDLAGEGEGSNTRCLQSPLTSVTIWLCYNLSESLSLSGSG